MAAERNEQAPAVAPGEPEAPVAGAEPAPAPAAAEGSQPDTETKPEPNHGPRSEEQERRVERDLEELAAKAEKADEYLELAQRTKADFENFRRRAAREAAAAQEHGVAKLAKELLPAVDNLDRALEAAQAAAGDSDGDENTLASGIKLVHADVIAALARLGVQPFSSEGEKFDPQRHEAVAQQPIEGAEPGTVVEVYQRGYRLGESVLRPARVLVAG